MRTLRRARIALVIASLVLVSLVIASLVLTSRARSTGQVIILGPNQVPCEQGGSSACYLIKDKPSDPWSVVNSTFERLTPVDGTQYTLLVHEINSYQNGSDPYAIPKATFRVVDVLSTEQVNGRIKWYSG